MSFEAQRSANTSSKKKQKLAPYQKYFQGYTEAKVAKKNGKGFKVIRLYTDPWWVHDMDDKKWVLQKAIVGVLSILSLAVYIASAANRVSGNVDSAVVIVGGLLSAAALLFQLVWTGIYVTRPRKMTVYDCESSSKNLKVWSFVAAAILAFTGVASFIYGLVSDSGTLLSSLGYLVSGAALVPVILIENKTEYTEEFNDTQIPFDRYSDF